MKEDDGMKQFIGYQKGVDLGGWLSQGSYDKQHLDSFITEEDISRIAGWGADHVRVPVDYNIFETDDGCPKEEGMAYVENAYSWCVKNGINMILDLHKTYGFSFYSGDKEEGFFDSEELQERFYKLWERFAERFGKYSEHMAFELLNEVTDPKYSDTWNKVVNKVIGIIRRYAPDTKILVGGYWNNSIDALKDLDMPYDENIVYNFHCYDPFLFTHQAAHWVDEMPDDLKVSYPGDIAFYRSEMKRIGLTYMQDYMDVPESGFDSSYFEKHFAGAVKLCEERNVSLYCGEYGVIDKASPEEVVKWYKDINAAFIKFGIGRATWNYKGKDFGLIDDGRAAILDQIVKYL